MALPLTSVASTNPDRCALLGAARAFCSNRRAGSPLLRASAALRSCLAITCKPLTYCRHDSQRAALMHCGVLRCTAPHRLRRAVSCCAVCARGDATSWKFVEADLTWPQPGCLKLACAAKARSCTTSADYASARTRASLRAIHEFMRRRASETTTAPCASGPRQYVLLVRCWEWRMRSFDLRRLLRRGTRVFDAPSD